MRDRWTTDFYYFRIGTLGGVLKTDVGLTSSVSQRRALVGWPRVIIHVEFGIRASWRLFWWIFWKQHSLKEIFPMNHFLNLWSKQPMQSILQFESCTHLISGWPQINATRWQGTDYDFSGGTKSLHVDPGIGEWICSSLPLKCILCKRFFFGYIGELLITSSNGILLLFPCNNVKTS